MAAKSLGEQVAGELAGKAVMWGPAIAGALLLGPVGVLLGLVASANIAASGSRSAVPDGDQASSVRQ
jgi:hypothetical protein